MPLQTCLRTLHLLNSSGAPDDMQMMAAVDTYRTATADRATPALFHLSERFKNEAVRSEFSIVTMSYINACRRALI